MTPKEKAKELKDKYMNVKWQIYLDDAKQCALIAVNGILDANPMYYTGFEYESNLEYWEQVKTEIEKL
jgi:hypothetical protein